MHPASTLRTEGVTEGEIMVSIDNRPLIRVSQYVSYLRTKAPGEKVRLTLLNRETGEQREVEVQLGMLEGDWHRHAGG